MKESSQKGNCVRTGVYHRETGITATRLTEMKFRSDWYEEARHWGKLVYSSSSSSSRSHGRHDCFPASFVTDFIFCCSDGSHVPVDTAHPYLLRSSSLSSPMSRGTISRVSLPTYSLSHLLTYPNHLNLAFLLFSVILSTLCLSLMLSFLMWSLSMWPYAHNNNNNINNFYGA